MSNKPNLTPIYQAEEETKGYTGFAHEDKELLAKREERLKKLKKPNFPAALVKNEPDKPIEKRVKEINSRKKPDVKKHFTWFNKLFGKP